MTKLGHWSSLSCLNGRDKIACNAYTKRTIHESYYLQPGMVGPSFIKASEFHMNISSKHSVCSLLRSTMTTFVSCTCGKVSVTYPVTGPTVECCCVDCYQRITSASERLEKLCQLALKSTA